MGEIDQINSDFEDNSWDTFISTKEFFDSKDSRQSKFRFSDNNNGNYFEKILFYAYRWLDSISGKESYLLGSQNYKKFAPYEKIINILSQHNIVARAGPTKKNLNDAPSFYRFNIASSFPAGITDGKTNFQVHGSSIGHDAEKVISKSIGEFLERYFLTLYHKKKLVRASPRSLKKKGVPALDLNLLARFSERQKETMPRKKWNDDSIFWWEKIELTATGEKFLVPAQLVYWNYALDDDFKEPFLAERNTNGCGGMFTKEGAILSGLYELIQRDAFLMWWLNALSPPKIDPESVPDETFQQMVKEAKRYGFKIHCLNTTLDTAIPSVAVVIEDLTDSYPKFSLGAGCERDPIRALENAFGEAWSINYSIRSSAPMRVPQDYQPFIDNYFGHNERLRLFATKENAHQYAFFLGGATKKFSDHIFNYPESFPSEKEELKEAVKRIESLGPGYEVYSYICAHPILSSLGYFSARTIVPKLMMLYLNETNAALETDRINKVLKFLGRGEGKINTWPHPFP